jgi:uncharacterized membrane protein YbhN (UPF0104 family)
MITDTKLEETLPQQLSLDFGDRADTSDLPDTSFKDKSSQGDPAQKPAMSKNTKLLLKSLISIVLLASLFVFGKVDFSKSWEAAKHANFWYLGFAVALFLSSYFLNAHRWQLLAAAVGLKKPLLKLTQYCYVGLFFNLFLPSTVGGDVSRCYYLSKGTNKWANAFYSVLADRVLGISVLFLMATLGIVFGPGGFSLPWQLKWPIYAGTAFVFGVIPLVPRLARMILGEKNWITRQFTESAAAVYWKDKNLMAVSLMWSLVLQALIVVVHIAIGFALGLTQVPIWYYFVFYPSVAVLGFITPTFNGIGIREWAYTYFLVMMGVDKSHALTYAIIWLGLTTLISLVGGVVYALGHLQLSSEEMEKMQHQTLS